MRKHSMTSWFPQPAASEITPPQVFAQRRRLLQQMAAGAAGASLATWAARDALAAATPAADKLAALPGVPSKVPGAQVQATPTPYADASSYNNFYEFGYDKQDPARYAGAMPTRPWTVRVEGLVQKPGVWALEDLLKLSPMEERLYRLRCVEGWSMVIPWEGYSLSRLLELVQPLGSAKFVEFVTQTDAQHMPGLRHGGLDWPYTEGLRLDEAMHPLTLLAFGMYGHVLPNQNGAPVRLVVPWKYGFKSAKSVVAIRVLEQMPTTAWVKAAPHEYGFYANVNPNVPHRRWSQASERTIGQGGLFAPKRKTELFNGYAEQVGQLYAGMDLKRYY